MVLSIIICALTIFTMIFFIMKKPSIKIYKYNVDSFWIITLLGAFLMIILGLAPLKEIKDILFTDSNINPLKILILLISISFLSICLDELGFFSYVSIKATKIVKTSQYKLFFIIYAMVSILTVFTSNDIVILTFTLFICYFSREAKINPIPYLVMEFVGANTYSMMLYIGNPTNVYLASVYEIGFMEYFKIMAIPTLITGVSSLLVLLLIFRKDLAKPMDLNITNEPTLYSVPLTIIGLIHLFGCTILLALSNYINIEMWIISLLFFLSLMFILLIYSIIKKTYTVIKMSVKRLPFNLIVFVLSMFVIILTLNHYYIFKNIGNFLNNFINNKYQAILVYGVSSSISCNILNNIPMTLAFSNIIPHCSYLNASIYATIIGSNLGAFITPIGALAGIMWMNILKRQNVEFNFLSFIKYGGIIAVVSMIVALNALYIFI